MNILVNGHLPEYWREKRLKELAEQRAEQAKEAARRAEEERKRLEDLARKGGSPSPEPVSPGPAPPQPSPAGDDFSIDDIVTNPQGNYEFRGLVVPGGVWTS